MLMESWPLKKQMTSMTGDEFAAVVLHINAYNTAHYYATQPVPCCVRCRIPFRCIPDAGSSTQMVRLPTWKCDSLSDSKANRRLSLQAVNLWCKGSKVYIHPLPLPGRPSCHIHRVVLSSHFDFTLQPFFHLHLLSPLPTPTLDLLHTMENIHIYSYALFMGDVGSKSEGFCTLTSSNTTPALPQR